ncbi:MAG: RluA family pseudouridine synthase [Clostridiales bacterium]|nr:RluA family pseudouridine synthase [Clostridiales bacterium]
MNIKFIAKKSDNNLTVGFFLEKNSVSKRLITKLKQVENGITLNGQHTRTIDTIKEGDIVCISHTDKKLLDPNHLLDVEIAYEDQNVVIFDKPPHMPVHPSIKHQGDTLGNYFASQYPTLTFRPINRLDRDTSGLCIVAKNPYAAKVIQNQIKKTYFAVVCGTINQYGTINLPIAREDGSIIKRIVNQNGQKAVTHYKTITTNEKYTLLEISLETGRTHQIRVHFSHLGFPLAGDTMYGGETDNISRQALHCGELVFNHPISNSSITVKSTLPDDIKKLMILQ